MGGLEIETKLAKMLIFRYILSKNIHQFVIFRSSPRSSVKKMIPFTIRPEVPEAEAAPTLWTVFRTGVRNVTNYLFARLVNSMASIPAVMVRFTRAGIRCEIRIRAEQVVQEENDVERGQSLFVTW